ncbi:MAG: TetR/AcrR family transcriptional regulator [Rickettsiales bacterium]
MFLFWERGYESTSVRDIASRLNIPIASVYHSFGDKDSIFASTIDVYFNKYMVPLFSDLSNYEDAKQAIIDLFEIIIKNSSNSTPSGCYLVQTASDIMSRNPDIKSKLDDYFNYIKSSLYDLIKKAKNDKQIITQETNSNLSNYLFILMLSIKSCSRVGADNRQIRQYIKTALQPVFS